METVFRLAKATDVADIVRMLADDPLGKKRENYEMPIPESYLNAFWAIDRDPNNELIVACINNEVKGVLQLTLIPYLTYQGSWRALIEGVRIDSSIRGSGVGTKLLQYAIKRAAARGCHMVQLTTDKKRPQALHFYESLGFVNSHEGLKLHIN